MQLRFRHQTRNTQFAKGLAAQLVSFNICTHVMDLNVEINVVYFPLEEPSMCSVSHDPELYAKKVKETPWNAEVRAKGIAMRAEVHLIKIGPVTEEFLSRKKLNPALDFLQGVKFTLTEDNDYLWTSGEDLKGLPVHSKYQLIEALTRMGYQDADGYDRLPNPTTTESLSPVTKYVYSFNKKF